MDDLVVPVYAKKVVEQIQQYVETPEEMHVLPAAFHYWSVNYIAPRLMKVFGENQVPVIFANRLLSGSLVPQHYHFASIGCGGAGIEIAIAKEFIRRGLEQFTFDCYELSPVMLAEAQRRISEEGLDERFILIEADINQSKLRQSYHGIMAHHSLHHFVNLEQIFDDVRSRLIGDGSFVTYDVIGRNGHMRWPELLEIVEKIWKTLPSEKKYNHQLRQVWEKYINWDCSHHGFEGIRAQDILPNLLDRFHFTHFVAFGGLTDVFVDRAFGRNFDPEVDRDRAFIDWMEYLNDLLVRFAVIKPTIMFGSMRAQPSSCISIENISPHFCLRNPS